MKFLGAFLFLANYSFSQITACANVPGPGRDDAAACFADGAAFILSGNLANGFDESNRMYRYGIPGNQWTETVAFPGEARQYAAIFAIGKRIYFGLGISASGQLLKDFWTFDLSSENWQQLKDFEGEARSSLFYETDGSFGYIGTGMGVSSLLSDCWKYIPETDDWQPISNFPGAGRREAVAFSLFGRIYAGLGFTNMNGTNLQSDFYRYDPFADSWQQVDDFPGGKRAYAVAVDNGTNGLVGTGYNEAGTWRSDLYLYDGLSAKWKAMDSIPSGGIRGMSSFSANGDFYLLTGTVQGEGRSSRVWKIAQQQTETGFSVFPNPVNGYFRVVADSGRVDVFDVNGRLVASDEIRDHSASFTGIRPGAYIVKYTSDKTGASRTEKIVVVD